MLDPTIAARFIDLAIAVAIVAVAALAIQKINDRVRTQRQKRRELRRRINRYGNGRLPVDHERRAA